MSDDSNSVQDEGVIEPPKTDKPFVYPEYSPVVETDGEAAGFRFDFNCGVRIEAPKELPTNKIRLILRDASSGAVLHSGLVSEPEARVVSTRKYYVPYCLELVDEKSGRLLYAHQMDLAHKDVLVQMPVRGAIGDSLAWFSVIDRFRIKHNARVHVLMPPRLAELFRKEYQDLVFETEESAAALRPYATYYLGLFFGGDEDWQPYDFRLTSLTGQAANILGLEDNHEPPRICQGTPADIKEPYVCIAVQASSHSKHWCRPDGWRTVINVLRNSGYRVLCIDKDRDVGVGEVWHSIPQGCEDWTGDRPFEERVGLLRGAKCFIGLSSGLSWLAWCCGTPVVRISGICAPWGEFPTPYNVQCRHSCHGCWNDTRYEFSHVDFMWCPKHKDTGRAYECTKVITPTMVLDAVARIPSMRLRKPADRVVRYSPDVFNVDGIEQAKRIILTKETEYDTDFRWEHETPALLEMMRNHMKIEPGAKVVDYGCGIGRMAKLLCGLGCSVVGVDISDSMRKMAVGYVSSDRFKAVSPDEFRALLDRGERFDFSLAVWVLQHCSQPDHDVGLIASALRDGGSLFVVNNKNSRALPGDDGKWWNDGIDIWKICRSRFSDELVLPFPSGVGLVPEHFQCALYSGPVRQTGG